MKKKFFVVLLTTCFAAMLGLVACSQREADSTDDAQTPAAEESAEATTEQETTETESEPIFPGAAYGYAGDDPVELAVYKYMVEEVSKQYDAADVSIPVVQIVNVDYTNPDEVTVSGDFWIFNYNIEGDTLSCVSGGNYPGVMHMSEDGDNYAVSSFDVVADGANFDESAKELFGDNYDDFMTVYSDSDAREELRTITVSDYVNMNDLEITQYQDYGWDPVQLYK